MTEPRRFPTPWKVEKIPGGFIVKDANGVSLAYVYSDNRQLVASNIAKLPGLLSAKDH